MLVKIPAPPGVNREDVMVLRLARALGGARPARHGVVSALGGSARRVIQADNVSSRPQWSADGAELACVVRKESGGFAEIVFLESGQSRLVPLPGEEVDRRDLSWSPDGRFFSYVDPTSGASNAHQLWVTRLADGKGVPVTEASTEEWSPTWSPDSRTLYYVSNRGGSMDLWQQPIGNDGMPDGEPRAVTSGLVIRRAAMSPDGTKLAYSKGRRIANIWRVPLLPDRPARWADAEQITFDQALIEFVDVSPDGERILFSSDRSGNHDIWLMRLEGRDMVQVTRDPAGDWAPRWSPDGLSVVFYSKRSGNRDVWVQPLEAGPARQVTQHEADDYWPSWSPDGDKLAFTSARDGNARQLFVISVDGGDASRVTVGSEATDLFSDWSTDGSQVLFGAGRDVFVVSAAGGAASRVIQRSGAQSRWSRDGRRIYFKGAGDRAGDMWEVQRDGSGARPVTDLAGRPGLLGYEPPTTDGTHLYFIWVEDLGDIWVMDVVQE